MNLSIQDRQYMVLLYIIHTARGSASYFELLAKCQTRNKNLGFPFSPDVVAFHFKHYRTAYLEKKIGYLIKKAQKDGCKYAVHTS